MVLKNRVDPFGQIHATPERGAWMGNRGFLQGNRTHAHSHWITCLLQFKGRKRALMTPGRYTELFFLDEATAYAAGHRPCAECRRADYRAFSALWAEVHGPAKAAEIDRRLRAAPPLVAESLPDGTMVAGPEGPVLIWRGTWDWSFSGYRPRAPLQGAVRVLTPAPIVALLARGLKVQVHESAGGTRTG